MVTRASAVTRNRLQVVSLDREGEIASAKAATEIGVDVLLGGTRICDILPIVARTGIQYFPFPGRVVGGLVVGGGASPATGTAEREEALALVDGHRGRRPITLGADKAYDVGEFVASLRARSGEPAHRHRRPSEQD